MSHEDNPRTVKQHGSQRKRSMTYCPKRMGQTDNLPSARPYTASADPQRDRQPWASQRASSGQTRGPKPLGFLGKRRGSTHSPCTTPPPRALLAAGHTRPCQAHRGGPEDTICEHTARGLLRTRVSACRMARSRLRSQPPHLTRRGLVTSISARSSEPRLPLGMQLGPGSVQTPPNSTPSAHTHQAPPEDQPGSGPCV